MSFQLATYKLQNFPKLWSLLLRGESDCIHTTRVDEETARKTSNMRNSVCGQSRFKHRKKLASKPASGKGAAASDNAYLYLTAQSTLHENGVWGQHDILLCFVGV